MLHLGEVNLYKLCEVFSGNAQSSSHYKRLLRFIAEVSLCQRALARFLVAMMGTEAGAWRLALDRTNWKIGKTHINILYLSLCHKTMAIPLFWSFLEDKKQGNSDHLDRIDLLETFIQTFGKSAIGVLLMDREFIGKHWLEAFLQAQGIAYVVRLKESGYLANARGKSVKMMALFHGLKPGEIAILGKRKVGKGKEATTQWITAMRLKSAELLVLAHSEAVADACAEYRHRWQIEVMFKGLKTGGFALESTRVVQPDRLETLTAVLAIAFCAAYKAGEEAESVAEIPRKKHGYRAKSIFRTGLDTLRKTLTTQKRRWKQIWVKIEKSVTCSKNMWQGAEIVR